MARVKTKEEERQSLIKEIRDLYEQGYQCEQDLYLVSFGLNFITCYNKIGKTYLNWGGDGYWNGKENKEEKQLFISSYFEGCSKDKDIVELSLEELKLVKKSILEQKEIDDDEQEEAKNKITFEGQKKIYVKEYAPIIKKIHKCGISGLSTWVTDFGDFDENVAYDNLKFMRFLTMDGSYDDGLKFPIIDIDFVVENKFIEQIREELDIDCNDTYDENNKVIRIECDTLDDLKKALKQIERICEIIKPKKYTWSAECDDGCWFDSAEKVFDTKKQCYYDMRDHALEKMKWNTEWEDVTDNGGDVNSTLGYKVHFGEETIVHESYSGVYTYKIKEV